MKRAFIYSRVSTVGQTDGVSPETQVARARAWCVVNASELAGEFSDHGISAKRADNRPGLQAALRTVCASKGVLVVYSLSRLARSVPDAYAIVQRLQKCGADLVSLSESIDTTTAMGRAFFGFVSVLSQLERELIAERTAAALQQLKATGRPYGEVPYGKRLVRGALIDAPDETRTLERMRDRRQAGATFGEIAREMNADGVRTKKNESWTSANVRKLVLALAKK
jgi:site-specific DNA recombinase